MAKLMTTTLLAVAAGLASPPNYGQAHASTFTVLHAFSFSDIGYVPTGDLVLDGAGDIFGTTATGNQAGTVFRYTPSSSSFQTLFSFTGAADGSKPQGSLVLAGRYLFGTTGSGGASNAGTIYRLNLTALTLKTLHTFTDGVDGASPYGGLTLHKGELFGSALQAGAGNGGLLYSINPSTRTLIPLHVFNAKGENAPIGNVVFDSAGVIYGANELYAQTATGAIYSYVPVTNKFTILHAFTNTKTGAVPFAGVALFENVLYGTTTEGGEHNMGTVWKYDLVKHTFSVMHSFAGAADGNQLQARPVITSAGILYGTAYGGGAYNDGTVYQVNVHTGKFAVVHNFDDTDGKYPEAGIALGKTGTLYGTTALGGPSGAGLLFSITP